MRLSSWNILVLGLMLLMPLAHAQGEQPAPPPSAPGVAPQPAPKPRKQYDVRGCSMNVSLGDLLILRALPQEEREAMMDKIQAECDRQRQDRLRRLSPPKEADGPKLGQIDYDFYIASVRSEDSYLPKIIPVGWLVKAYEELSAEDGQRAI